MAIFKAAESKHTPAEETILLHFVPSTDGSISVELSHSDGRDVSDGPGVVKFIVENGKLSMYRYGFVSPTYVNTDAAGKIKTAKEY